MEHILEPNEHFQFDKLSLSSPIFIHSGNYFMKYLYENSPLYIQAPKCITKQGIMKGGKRMYCDMLFTNENSSFIRWIEDLENYSQKYIYENRTKWFENELEMHDIENSFTSPLKVYKSGKYYIIRTIIPTRLGKCTLKIYDENEMEVDPETIQDGTSIISIWEIQGIKCSSKNFQIDIEVKQMMVIKPSKLFEKCLINKQNNTNLNSHTTNNSIPDTNISTGLNSENFSLEETKNTETLPPIMDDSLGKIEESENSISTPNVSTTIIEEPTFIEEPPTLEEINQEIKEELTLPPPPLDEYVNENDDTHESVDDVDDESEVEVLEIDDENDDTDITPSISVLDKSLEVVDLDNDVLVEDTSEEKIELMDRNDVYSEIYLEATKNATYHRNLAISRFLETKKIKDFHRIQDFLENLEEEE